jgi:hypothetical protein
MAPLSHPTAASFSLLLDSTRNNYYGVVCTGFALHTAPPRIGRKSINTAWTDPRRKGHVHVSDNYRYVPVFAGGVCSMLRTSCIAGEVSV